MESHVGDPWRMDDWDQVIGLGSPCYETEESKKTQDASKVSMPLNHEIPLGTGRWI